VAGGERISTIVAALVDTNVLVYIFDPGDRCKQRIATELLDQGLQQDSLRLADQTIVEFVSAVTRPRRGGKALMSRTAALREAEDLLAQFAVLYPNEALLRTALRGACAYQLSSYDAHMWAYAEHYGLAELYSEVFEDGRLFRASREPLQGLKPPCI
jgi:predicted nucleic acid-binding protein